MRPRRPPNTPCSIASRSRRSQARRPSPRALVLTVTATAVLQACGAGTPPAEPGPATIREANEGDPRGLAESAAALREPRRTPDAAAR